MADAVAIYDYLNANGANPIEEFIRASIEAKERAKLLARVQALRGSGYAILGGNVLTDTREKHVKEIRVNGNVAVRMLMCRGPVNGNKEATLLFGAFERDNKYDPKDAPERAEKRRKEVEADPARRRRIRQ
jgi:hypothetical protein